MMKKKIGFCIDSLEMGGAEKLLVDIIELLYSTNKYEIYLLTKNESNSYFYEQIKEKIKYYYLISRQNEEKNKKYGNFGKILNSIIKRKNFKNFSSHVEILIDFLDGDFCKFIKKEKNKKKIIWLHSEYEYLKNNKKIEKKLKYYNLIVTITNEMYFLLKNNYNDKDVRKIYNYIDFEKINTKLLENNEKHSLKEKEYFLTVTRLNEEHKDITTLLKAFKEYKGKEKLYIIGDGKSREELEKLTKDLEIEDKVEFLGMKLNPYIYMKRAKTFILSSKGEGFGLVIAEVLFCGTKVIASDCNYGPREILLNGEIGELFQVGNVEELVKKIENIENCSYSKDKIKDSLKRFDKKNILKKLEEIVNE